MCGGQRHAAECDCASVECIVNKNRRSNRPQGHRVADEQQSRLTQGTRGLVSPATKRLAIRLDEPSIRDKAPSRQHLSTTCAKSCSTPGYALHSNLSRSDVAAQIAPRLSCDRPQIAHISKIPSFRKYLCNLTSTPRLQLPLLRPVTPADCFLPSRGRQRPHTCPHPS